METTTVVPLTSSHLESFSLSEKADKSHLLRSFLQGQKPYERKFAADGKKSFSTWNQNASERKRRSTPVQTSEFGFGTPVLKARAPKSPLVAAAKPKQDLRKTNAETPGPDLHSKRSTKNTSVKPKSTKKPHVPKSKHPLKRIREPGSDDDELAARKSSYRARHIYFSHFFIDRTS